MNIVVHSERQFPTVRASLLIKCVRNNFLRVHVKPEMHGVHSQMSEGKTKWIIILEFQKASLLPTPLYLFLQYSLSFTYSITPLFNGFRRVRITSGKRASFEFQMNQNFAIGTYMCVWKPSARWHVSTTRWSKWKRRRMGRIATVIHRRRNHRLTPRWFQKSERGENNNNNKKKTGLNSCFFISI